MKKSRVKKTEKPEPPPIPASFAPVAAAFSKDTEVALEKGWGSGNLVLKVRGKIFVMLQGEKLVAKLPEERVDELAGSGVGERFDPRRDGRVMKEWIVVARGKASWVDLAREAHRFLRGGESRRGRTG